MELWYTENQTENVNFSMKVKKHLYSNQSSFQKIDVLDTYEFGRVLVIDNWTMVTEKDEFIYHEMITHVAMATNENIENVLVIGAGDGGTVRELTRYKNICNIDMVEIDEDVVKASKEFLPFTANKLDDERVNLLFEDGIKFIKGKEKVYDLIIVDSTDPIGPGEGLFTTEFYKDCFDALTDKGILINQCESPYYPNNQREMRRSFNKLKDLFNVCEAYQYHMPTYPSGHWMFCFASKDLHPIKDFNAEKWNALGLKTKYYNTDLHIGAFMLPNYVKDLLDK
ncbi:polyamine aminopropyltransferase [Clostridium chauvoei]|nr:polyamine aminopropyltransferase [Clostridium chauvoei]ATD56173.1 spermidine synthase [Clostridium chauvoei]ATD58742.1 spermidine synthase [Clostridium chauvoei]MBX7281666.1 polyamine aminopropyltransferase [Clostridium chauvoei]MBX7284195.1 polyamine aminopropyltransferase [Clostridium chauvoei]MBX7286723.1 polyamine aminopropyltransferase [Clostridium chauvoei]